MSCLVKMRATREELSANEKKIADFILENSALIRDYSSQNLAAAVGVSQSGIIKFSQKLNYRGFTDLKLAIHESVVKSDSTEEAEQKNGFATGRTESISQPLHNIKNEALLATMELNDERRIMSAVKLLDEANRIQIIALGAGSLVARNLASMLNQVGKPVIAELDAYIQLSTITTLGKGDVVFIISYSGQSKNLVQVARLAKKAGAGIVSLTNYNANPIRSLADVALFCVNGEGDFEFPQIISTTSQQHVVDVLFSCMLMHDSKSRELLALSRLAMENI